MQVGTKRRGGRPRKFDEAQALESMQRQLWTTGLSGTTLDGIARSAGINRPSLAASFGDKDAIYARAATVYAAMMDARMNEAISSADLRQALTAAFDTAIDIYTSGGPDGCFLICTAPADALTNPVCQGILDLALESIDAMFLHRLEREDKRTGRAEDLHGLASMLGATLNSIALRARAGWSPERLRTVAAGAIRQVLSAIEHTARSNKRDGGNRG